MRTLFHSTRKENSLPACTSNSSAFSVCTSPLFATRSADFISLSELKSPQAVSVAQRSATSTTISDILLILFAFFIVFRSVGKCRAFPFIQLFYYLSFRMSTSTFFLRAFISPANLQIFFLCAKILLCKTTGFFHSNTPYPNKTLSPCTLWRWHLWEMRCNRYTPARA